MNKTQWTVGLGTLAWALSSPLALAQQTEPAQPTPAIQPASKPQATQTAEGAQRFLATVVRKGFTTATFIDAQKRTNYVQGKASTTSTEIGMLSNDEKKTASVVEKQLAPFSVTEVDSLGPDGRPDACLTRIAKWEVKEKLFETQTWASQDEGFFVDTPIAHVRETRYELSPELLAPHWIDWRNVKLYRTPNGAQMTVEFKEKSFSNILWFTGETELVDRVEYAMKFLKMSCDDTTATGF